MHFFYIDESGCTGGDLSVANQPVFVMGGISVRDEGWNRTQAQFTELLSDYFDGTVPEGFELHASELLNAGGKGPFASHSLDGRLQLARDVLNLLVDRSHQVHLFAIDKARMAQSQCNAVVAFDTRIPYLCAFDYLVTYINDQVKNHLGRSARGMVILDRKDQFSADVENITHSRRYNGPAAHRVKWVVEFTYPVDSRKNPMVQISDLVVVCARRFFEIEGGYRDDWPAQVKQFYFECYALLHDRIQKKQLVERNGRDMNLLNDHLAAVRAQPTGRWKTRYAVASAAEA